MVSNRCAVNGCENKYVTASKRKDKNISFHVFPKAKDKDSMFIRNEWIIRCKRPDIFNPNQARICSDHFSEKDFERDLQNELLGLPIKKKLKKTAVPKFMNVARKKPNILLKNPRFNRNRIVPKIETTKDITKSFLSKIKNEKNGNSEQEFNDYYNICRNIKVEQEQTSDSEGLYTPLEFVNCCKTETEEISFKNSSNSFKQIDFKNKYSELSNKFKTLKSKYNRIKNKYSRLKETSSKKVELFKEEKSRYKKRAVIIAEKSRKKKFILKLIEKVLTENESALLLNRKKRLEWSELEISAAFKLRCYSKSCYLYLRNKLGYCLPPFSIFKNVTELKNGC